MMFLAARMIGACCLLLAVDWVAGADIAVTLHSLGGHNADRIQPNLGYSKLFLAMGSSAPAPFTNKALIGRHLSPGNEIFAGLYDLSGESNLKNFTLESNTTITGSLSHLLYAEEPGEEPLIIGIDDAAGFFAVEDPTTRATHLSFTQDASGVDSLIKTVGIFDWPTSKDFFVMEREYTDVSAMVWTIDRTGSVPVATSKLHRYITDSDGAQPTAFAFDPASNMLYVSTTPAVGTAAWKVFSFAPDSAPTPIQATQHFNPTWSTHMKILTGGRQRLVVARGRVYRMIEPVSVRRRSVESAHGDGVGARGAVPNSIHIASWPVDNVTGDPQVVTNPDPISGYSILDITACEGADGNLYLGALFLTSTPHGVRLIWLHVDDDGRMAVLPDQYIIAYDGAVSAAIYFAENVGPGPHHHVGIARAFAYSEFPQATLMCPSSARADDANEDDNDEEPGLSPAVVAALAGAGGVAVIAGFAAAVMMMRRRNLKQ